MSIGRSKNKLEQPQDNQNRYLRMKRKLQVLFLVVSLMSASVMMTGCSSKNKDKENATVSENQNSVEEEGTSNPTTTPTGEEEGNQQGEDNQTTDDNTSEQGDNDTDTSSGDGSNNQTGETPENNSSQTEANSGQNTTDPFFATEEGTKLYEVADAFTNAYLNQNDDVAKEYMAKDATYEGLDESYGSVQLLDLKLYSFDETTKEAYVSYAFVGNGEDSYTYLSMEIVSEEGAYKVSMYGLEK